MRTPANIAKHPIHPMLVAIPIGLWIFSLICVSVVCMVPPFLVLQLQGEAGLTPRA